MNLGLNPYFRYDVVFDVAQGKVGFASCTADATTVPTPALSAWAMGLMTLLMVAVGYANRKPRARKSTAR